MDGMMPGGDSRLHRNSGFCSAAEQGRINMADYVLVTDGTADLPGELFAKLGVEVVPMEDRKSVV